MKFLGMDVTTIWIPLLACVVCGFIANGIGSKKGYGSALSFCAGFFLTVLGIIIMAVVPDKGKSDTGAEAIAKYKQLLDDGAISQEEFDKKKKELL